MNGTTGHGIASEGGKLQLQGAGSVAQLGREVREFFDGAPGADRLTAIGAVGRQAEEDAMRRQSAFILAAIH